ncbi:ATP-grasp domain-containing protein [Candidatus Bathyarchaeota archaeon]|nr:MAG: ATP-grasp domain-containing protein [Candidatus Bathyarchaeota archaeon]
MVGPEAPLGLGIVDSFRAHNLKIFGPSQNAARIETSKSFAKDLCTQFHIPTPRWKMFTSESEAIGALDGFGPPWVVKADGLAAGKGTTVTRNKREAEAAIHRELQREPGRIVLEEFIDGWEATFMATVSKGQVQWLTPVFQDYKPLSDGDAGPNTGGMGCFTPIPTVTPSLVEKVRGSILSPVVAAMEKVGVHYQGVLNLNAIVRRGSEEPFMLEFNARFGDPEGQGCVVVVLASKGYPASPTTGDKIMIRPVPDENVTFLHAGTSKNSSGELVTAGGRVLNVVATGDSVERARKAAYSTIKSSVQFKGMQYRTDIGAHRARRRELAS